MNISALTIRLLLLLVPGVLWSYIADAFTVHKDRKPFFFVLQSLLYGFLSYFAYWVILHACYLLPFSISRPIPQQIVVTPPHTYPKVAFLQALLNQTSPISFAEIILVCLLAIVLALFYTWVVNKKLCFRFAHKLGITRKFADDDVWGFTFNSDDLDQWVTVRDHANDLMYSGWINAFSDNSRDAEVLLRDVSVYKNSTAEPLYQTGCMYIFRSRERITVEFGNVPVAENVVWKENEDGGQDSQDG